MINIAFNKRTAEGSYQQCDDVLLSLVCDISGNFCVPWLGRARQGQFLGLTYSAVGKAGFYW